mgnify:CR=1 FL=1
MSNLKEALAAGKHLVGLMLQELREPFVLHLLKDAGYDFVILDMEHGTYDFHDIAHLSQVAKLLGLTPLVRPPDHTYPWIARALDAGAQGLMVPRVSSPDQVRQVLSAMKFPPVGVRGMAGQRGHTDYRSVDRIKHAERMNRENVLIVQIELAEAVERLDEILTVDGVDVALVGPGDLSVSLGCSSLRDPRLEEAIQRVVNTCKRRGVPSAIQIADLEAVVRWTKAGMQLVVLGTDVSVLNDVLSEKIKHVRSQA